MQRNRNRDVQLLNHGLYHGGHGFKAGHVLSGALADTKDNRAVLLLRGQQHRLCPLQVVDVELADCIVASLGLLHHFCNTD